MAEWLLNSSSLLAGFSPLIPSLLFANRSGTKGEQDDRNGAVRKALCCGPLCQQAVENNQRRLDYDGQRAGG